MNEFDTITRDMEIIEEELSRLHIRSYDLRMRRREICLHKHINHSTEWVDEVKFHPYQVENHICEDCGKYLI